MIRDCQKAFENGFEKEKRRRDAQKAIERARPTSAYSTNPGAYARLVVDDELNGKEMRTKINNSYGCFG